MKGRERDHQKVIGEMRRILLDYLAAVAKWTKNRLIGQMIHEREPSAAGHWSAEKVAPLVRHLPKARQTVLDDVDDPERKPSVVVIIHKTRGNRWRTELCAEQPTC
jgi:hypothetical protein